MNILRLRKVSAGRVNIMHRQKKMLRQTAALLLAASLFLVSCRSNLIATTMELNKTEGTVNIHDKRQKEIEPKEQLDLYSGYQVETLQTSYAWINLDKVKLTKMDAESEIEITKKRNDLEIMIRSGKLFFHVTEPLEDNESLNIRTSSMVVGVRGTCGWVDAQSESQMRVYILEGTVKCRPDTSDSKAQTGKDSSGKDSLSLKTLLGRFSKDLPLSLVPSNGTGSDDKTIEDESAEDDQVYVSAGEMAELTISSEGEAQIIVSEFTAADIPDYVMEELLEDEELQQKILEESGLDIHNTMPDENEEPDSQTPEEEIPEDETGQASFFLNNTVYYGDPDKCRLTPAQAALFAESLQSAILTAQTENNPYIEAQRNAGRSLPFRSYAAMFDAGNGIPAIFFDSGYYLGTGSEYLYEKNPGKEEIYWEMLINRTVFFLGEPDEVYHTGESRIALGDGYLFYGGLWGDGSSYEGYVRPLVDGNIERTSTMASADFFTQEYQIDWNPATPQDLEQWRSRWDGLSEVGFTHGTDTGGKCWGMVPAEEVLEVLNAYAGQQ